MGCHHLRIGSTGREATLIFPILYGLRLIYGNISSPGLSLMSRLRRGLLFLSVSIIPSVAWQVFLLLWLGSPGWGQGAGLFRLPLSGLFSLYPLGPATLDVVEVVVVPGLICLSVSIVSLWKDPLARKRVELWALLLNYILLVTLLYPDPLIELYAAGRISIPVVLSAVYSLSVVKSKWWFYCCAGLWLVSTVAYILNPTLGLFHRL